MKTVGNLVQYLSGSHHKVFAHKHDYNNAKKYIHISLISCNLKKQSDIVNKDAFIHFVTYLKLFHSMPSIDLKHLKHLLPNWKGTNDFSETSDLQNHSQHLENFLNRKKIFNIKKHLISITEHHNNSLLDYLNYHFFVTKIKIASNYPAPFNGTISMSILPLYCNKSKSHVIFYYENGKFKKPDESILKILSLNNINIFKNNIYSTTDLKKSSPIIDTYSYSDIDKYIKNLLNLIVPILIN